MKLSVIGTGRWGCRLVQGFRSLCSIHLVYGHQNRKGLQGVTFTEDIDKLIAESTAIVVATPPPTHYELAKKVIEAGRDVWIEKPMTLSSADAKELALLGDSNKCVVFVDHPLCYSSVIDDVKGRGEIEHIHCRSVKSSAQSTINSDWNLGIHMVAMAVLLGAGADEIGLETSHKSRVHEQIFTVKFRDAESVQYDMRRYGPNMESVYREFITAIEQRKKPLTDGWHGVRVIEVMEQISPSWEVT